ncbi:MAG TPA: signal peptidase I [Clostridiales bacterium]|nr:signal peptidase I [Clostridiales bacterium]
MIAPENKGKGKSKVFSIVCFSIAALFFILAVTIFFLAMQAKKQNKPLSVFGLSTSIVVTNSMEPEIKVGDLIVVKETTIDKIEVGENAVFTYIGSDEKIKGQRVVHEVIDKGENENGIYLVTKGINNPVEDADKVTAANFVGKEVAHNTFFGKVFGFFSHAENIFFIIVLVIVIPFIFRQSRKIFRLVKEGDKDDEDGFDGEKDDADKTQDEKERIRQELLKEYGVKKDENAESDEPKGNAE